MFFFDTLHIPNGYVKICSRYLTHTLAPSVYGLSGLSVWNYFTDSYNLVELCCMHGSGRQECGE
jgi:hypothetical protein